MLGAHRRDQSAGPFGSSAVQLGSASAVADSKQTLLCTYLSAVLLVGLLANSLLGWSWADPIAALVIAAVTVKEGRGGMAGRQLLCRAGGCGGPVDVDTAPSADKEPHGCGCGPACSGC